MWSNLREFLSVIGDDLRVYTHAHVLPYFPSIIFRFYIINFNLIKTSKMGFGIIASTHNLNNQEGMRISSENRKELIKKS